MQGYAYRISFPVADPWYDYLAIPIAPLILLIQLVSIFLLDRRMRWTVGLGCFAALIVMFLYVASVDLAPDEGANIGGRGDAASRRLARPRESG